MKKKVSRTKQYALGAIIIAGLLPTATPASHQTGCAIDIQKSFEPGDVIDLSAQIKSNSECPKIHKKKLRQLLVTVPSSSPNAGLKLLVGGEISDRKTIGTPSVYSTLMYNDRSRDHLEGWELKIEDKKLRIESIYIVLQDEEQGERVTMVKHNGCGPGVETKPHPNGGGEVATTARVDAKAYVGKSAAVCGTAVVGGGTFDHRTSLRDNAWVGGNAYVDASNIRGNAKIFGDARVWQRSFISGNAEISGNADITVANIDGNNIKISGISWVSSAGRFPLVPTVSIFDNVEISGGNSYTRDTSINGFVEVRNAKISSDVRVFSRCHKEPIIVSGRLSGGTRLTRKECQSSQ